MRFCALLCAISRARDTQLLCQRRSWAYEESANVHNAELNGCGVVLDDNSCSVLRIGLVRGSEAIVEIATTSRSFTGP